MSRFSQGSRCAAVVPCLLAALALLCATPARGQIFLQIPGIQGTGGLKFGLPSAWIEVQSVKIGDQIILASSPWHFTPPPKVRSVTLTKYSDVSSPGLSAAFASKQNLGTVSIKLVTLDARGVVNKVDEYRLNEAVLSSFTATPPTETLVLNFASISGGFPILPGAASDATSRTRSRSGGVRTLATRTP